MILNLQRRLHEVGRIRLGDQAVAKSGKKYPRKLASFRLTTQNEAVIQAAAQAYGGTPQRWADAPIGEQWELYTEAASLPVIVPPSAMAFSQFFEAWSGGGCTRRCDSVTELLTGAPCMCASEDEVTCKPTTRLSVMLRHLPGVGVWRCEAKGWNAAAELAGVVDVIQSAAEQGRLLPATLRLEQRQSKKNGETRNFAVPVLDIEMTMAALGAGPGVSLAQLAEADTADPAVALAAGPGFTPVDQAAMPAAPEQTVAEQVANPGRQRRAPGAKAAEPIKSTGMRPRARGAEPATEAPPPPDDEDTPTGPRLRPEQHLAMAARDAGITDDDQRHDLYEVVTGKRTGKDMGPKEHDTMTKVLARIKDGKATVDEYLLAVGKDSAAGSTLTDKVKALDDAGQMEMAAWFLDTGLVWPLTMTDYEGCQAKIDELGSEASDG